MHRSTVVSGLLGCALVVGACSNGDNGSGDGQPDDAQTGDTGTGQQAGEAQQLAATSMEQVATEEFVKFGLELDVGGQQISGKGTGRYADDPATNAVLSSQGQQLEVVLVGDSAFAKVPDQMRQMMESGAQWVDLARDQQAAQMMGGVDMLAKQADPTSVLTQVKQAGDVKESEQVDLDGETATKHTFQIRLDKLSDAFPAGLTKEAIKPLTDAGVESYGMRLWMNDNDLPIRAVMDLTDVYAAAAKMGGQPAPDGRSTSTMTYSAWGEPVEIEAPPENKVGQMPQIPQQPGGQQPPEAPPTN
ncbi:hypothetical protein [Haloechinothrix salitolerans]|uniref:LppX_LprAFG lipoprotein n=1 Tax=Haloechinothrix salitolerans TaxID=926830 RepID=A0ABW2C701_9PSEU